MINSETLSLDLEREKQNILQEEIERKKHKRELYREIVKKTSYEKGKVTKEVFKLPMPSSEKFLSNRELNIKIYGYLMLNSNWGGIFANENSRYLYKDKWDEVIKEACTDLNISMSTIKRHISKLKKTDINALALIKVNGNLVYKLNYSSFNKETGLMDKYVTIDNVVLRKLINAYSDYPLRLYLYFLYVLRNGEKLITQKTLCKVVGLSNNTRYVVSDSVDALINGGFLKIRCEYENDIVTKNGVKVENSIPRYYYSLSDEYLTKNSRDLKK